MSLPSDPLLDRISEAILIIDKEGYISHANPACCALMAYPCSALLNRSISVLYGEGDGRIKAEYEMEQARKAGVYSTEGWRLRGDGSRLWGELSIRPYFQGSEFSGYSCLLRETGGRQHELISLRRSEERYRLMVESVKDYAIFMLDPGGHILTWNDGAAQTKGYSANEIIGKHFSIFYTREDLEAGKPERELRIAMEVGKYEEEWWRVKKDGSLFWANVLITALYNEENVHIGFSKVTRDLTARRGNEEMLRQSEERYRSLVEQVTDYGIFLLDEKGRIISWNEGAKRIAGYSYDEIIGKYFSIFYPEEDILSGKPGNELRIARQDGKYEEEGWRIRKDGSRFWSSVVITAVYNEDGFLIGFSKVTRDLTERKEAERALRESYENYRMLAEELRKTNADLTFANKELQQFTSIVSHDLQEPVRTIKSFLQLLVLRLGQEDPETLRGYVDKSVEAANRMKELIHNLLNYSQISRNELKREDVNVDELIDHALQNLKTALEQANAHVTVHSEVDTVTGDRVQLLQVIQNLLSNALKFTKSGSPEIAVHCSRENGHVKFAVSDNGIGIEQTDLHKVFEIFRRLNTSKEFPGTGIGLAICKKIVDRHQGRIWPESQPGKGTTFYFTLNER